MGDDIKTNARLHLVRDGVMSMALVLLTLAVFGQVGSFEFLAYDDSRLIHENPAIMTGLSCSTVKWAFTHPNFGFYMPLTSLSHAVDVQLFGLWAGGHHLTSVALHACAAVLLYLALVYMTRRPWESVLAALLFAVHPLRAESVAWLASRKDVVSGVFWMAALLAYAWYARKPAWGRYLTVVLALVSSLLGKPVALTLPCVFLLLDWWPLGRLLSVRSLRWLILEKVPLFVLAVLGAVGTIWSEGQIGTMITPEQPAVLLGAETALVTYVRYIEHFFAPLHLAVYYPWSTMLMPQWELLLWALVLLTVSAMVLMLVKRRYLAVGWFWFLGVLLPLSGLIQIKGVTLSDRYTYVPSVGLCIALAWGLSELLSAFGKDRAWRIAMPLMTFVLAVALGIAGWWNVRFYHDGERLFARALAVTRDNDFAHTAMGYVREQQGRTDEALQHYLEAVRISPKYALWNGILADFLSKHGRVPGGHPVFPDRAPD